MKHITSTLAAALAAAALFTSSAASAADLSSFGLHSVEENLADGIIADNHYSRAYSKAGNPLSDLGASTEASLITGDNADPLTGSSVTRRFTGICPIN